MKKWKQNGITVAGGNGQGDQLNQLDHPTRLYMDEDGDDLIMYIVDTDSTRVMEWKSNAISGRIIAGGNGRGNQTNQIWSPISVIIDRNTDSIITCDYRNRRVMRWSRQNSTNGEILMSNISCLGLAVDNAGYIYVSDLKSREILQWEW